jgi:hypothetical protein
MDLFKLSSRDEAILGEYRILSDNYTVNEDGVSMRNVYFSKNRDSIKYH